MDVYAILGIFEEKMLPNITLSGEQLIRSLNLDFLENGSEDFANIENLNETSDTPPNASAPMVWKLLYLELWINCG